MFLAFFMVLSFWGYVIYTKSVNDIWLQYSFEFYFSLTYFVFFGSFYLLWLRPRINNTVQVFSTYLLIHKNKIKEELKFDEIESINILWKSMFYLKMKNGHKYYFNSSLERIDYIWEGIRNARPDLLTVESFENYRLKLVQYDHHQKRKEWFFRHKFIDIINWICVPLCFLFLAYYFQARDIFIYQKSTYFFRLGLYALLVLLVTSIIYSLTLKKLVFDRKLKKQIEEYGEKIRDLEFEGIILQKSKIAQFATMTFVLALIIKADFNLYSVTKIKNNYEFFNLKKGKTVVVDNRYNCIECNYKITEGDIVVFSRGHIGQVMAMSGDSVGEIVQDQNGRMIASENIQQVPEGHIAVKTSNGKDILFVKIQDLIGKIQK